MNQDTFWTVIDRVHAFSGGDMDEKCNLLREELEQLSDDDLRDFLEHFIAAEYRAYSWKLWAAAYIINGGCSDDGFMDFRATLISMGRTFYERALADPDWLASTEFDDSLSCYEGFQYVSNQVAQERFGDIPESRHQHPAGPSGDPWDEDDPDALAELLPKLSARYP